jgi:hypothetical protein
MIYLRIKRHKTTTFLQVAPNETIFKIKFVLSKLIKSKEPLQLRLFIPGKLQSQLENKQQIDQLGLVNDSILYLVYLEDGSWETVSVPEFESLYPEEKKE